MKGKTIALWVINVLMALLFFFAATQKLASKPEMVANFALFGLSVGFLHFIGTAELLGGIGLLVPRTRFWAAVGLIPIMAGAVFMHLSHHQLSHAPVAAVILVLVAVSACGRRGEAGRIFARGQLLTGT